MAKKRLPDLPPSDNNYWDNADINIQKMQKPNNVDYNFFRLSGTEAKCSRTQVGYYLFNNQFVRDGHIYNKDGKLII